MRQVHFGICEIGQFSLGIGGMSSRVCVKQICHNWEINDFCYPPMHILPVVCIKSPLSGVTYVFSSFPPPSRQNRLR